MRGLMRTCVLVVDVAPGLSPPCGPSQARQEIETSARRGADPESGSALQGYRHAGSGAGELVSKMFFSQQSPLPLPSQKRSVPLPSVRLDPIVLLLPDGSPRRSPNPIPRRPLLFAVFFSTRDPLLLAKGCCKTSSWAWCLFRLHDEEDAPRLP